MLVEGAVYFDNGVQVTSDCLGQTYKSRIGDTDVQIHFPELYITESLDEKHSSIHVVPPKAMSDPPQVVVGTSQGAFPLDSFESDPWGYNLDTSNIKNSTGHVIVTQAWLAFHTTHDPDSAELRSLARKYIPAKKQWWRWVKRWIQVISHQEIPSGAQLHRLLWDRNLSLWTRVGDETKRIDNGGFVDHGRFEERPSLTPEGIATVFQRAADRRPPELSWQVLSDAYRAEGLGEFRRAVVEVGMALELGAGDWLAKHMPDREVEKMSRKTLGSKVKKLEELDWGGPGLREVVDLRNDAVHRGASPQKDHVQAALQRVTDAMMIFYPDYKKIKEFSLEPLDPRFLAARTAFFDKFCD